MQRMQIYLTDEQRRMIATLAGDEGRSQADVIRRMLDRALGLVDESHERRRAITDSFGCLADERDPQEWLADVRGPSADERLRNLGL